MQTRRNMMRKSMIAAVAVLGLSVSACQTTDVGTTVGGLLGAAGGGLAANKFIGKGQGKKLATAAGVLGGGLLGGLFGKSMTMPYDNRQNIQNNSLRIDQNGYLIDQAGRRIDANRARMMGMQTGPGGTVVVNNGGYQQPQYQQPQPQYQGGTNNPYNCKVINNQVRCNSN